MNRLCVMAAVAGLLAAGSARAEQVLSTVVWSEQGGGDPLSVENPGPGPLTRTVWTQAAPGIQRPVYALRGWVRHSSVAGQAYLEMWSVFPDGGRYFSRTLARQGPMASMSADGDWRPVVVPFSNQAGHAPPSRLVLNVVLPGAGRIWLKDFELVQFDPGEDPLAAAAGAWFGPASAGLLGGVAGVILGLLGALLGLLFWRGRGRRLAAGLVVLAGLVGAGAAGFALVAGLGSQPFFVVYTLGLLGALGLLVAGIGWAVGRRRYQALELARMRARDLAG